MVISLALCPVKMAVKKRELSAEERREIITLHKKKLSQRKIRVALSFNPKPSVSTILRTIQRFDETKSNESKARSGRPQLLSNSDKRYVSLISQRDRRKCLSQVTQELNLARKKKSRVPPLTEHYTATGYLVSFFFSLSDVKLISCFQGRVAAAKPFLRLANIKKRLASAKKHVRWLRKQWRNVMWTDESKFEFFGNKRKTWVRRRVEEKFKRKKEILLFRKQST